MKKVVLLDTFSFDNFHLIFNFSLLYSLSKNHDIVLYYASNSYITNLKRLVESKNIELLDNIEYIPVYVPRGGNSVKYVWKYIYSSLLNICIILKHRKFDIYISVLNPFFFSVFNYISKKFGTYINIICHGELELLIKNDPFYKPSFLYKKEICNIFLRADMSKKIFFYVLSKSIKDNLVKEGYFRSNVKVVLHPYIFDIAENLTSLALPLVAGTIGIMSERKGYFDYIQFIMKFQNEINCNKIVFKHVGKIISERQCEYLKCKFYGLFKISNFEFNNEIATLSLALFFYPKNTYRLTASGAIFDVINHMKILIAIENDYFLDLFSLCGELGYLCTDIDQMYICLKSIIDGGEKIESDILLFRTNMAKAKMLYSYENFNL